jgi:hypothetical protein
MLRAFDPITLNELWNNQVDVYARDADKDYWFSKFVPPTIADGISGNDVPEGARVWPTQSRFPNRVAWVTSGGLGISRVLLDISPTA